MIDAVILDSGPLGFLAHPRANTLIVAWQESLVSAGISIAIPEIADYEVRRELLRARLFKSIDRLDRLQEELFYLELSTDIMRIAADFWAQARQTGQPTAHDHALDGDVILAAQATWLTTNFGHEVVVASTNPAHLSRFVATKFWEDIHP